jgi:hypothetical protein
MVLVKGSGLKAHQDILIRGLRDGVLGSGFGIQDLELTVEDLRGMV